MIMFHSKPFWSRTTVEVFDDYIGLFLPAHKGDAFFKGNCLIIHWSLEKAFELVAWYLTSQDQIFWACPELWLCRDGTIPTCSWFMMQLCSFFSKSIRGQSMHAGGATALAEAGVALALIQAAGRWSLDTFNCYIWKNVFLFEALLISCPSSLQTGLFHINVP